VVCTNAARVKSPTTVGKIERFSGSFEREARRFIDLERFRYRHNHVRPHQSLDYRRPADCCLETRWRYEQA
jgi:transposase InsO family protein